MKTAKKSAGKSKDKFAAKLSIPPIRASYKGSDKLKDKVAIVTGGDSGIGRAVAVHFAREGANLVIVYLESDNDAIETKKMVEAEGRTCMLFKGDISNERFCKKIADEVAATHKSIHILVNNAGIHEEDDSIEDISKKQLLRTFEVNIFSFFYLTQHVLLHMPKGGKIINTASVTAYRGSEHLIDYSATKGAIVSLTRSLAKNLAGKKINVNAIAPGPVWTPLVVESFDKKHLMKFGKDTAMGRAGLPYEIAPGYVYLACDDSAYMTGQVLHINGGDIING